MRLTIGVRTMNRFAVSRLSPRRLGVVLAATMVVAGYDAVGGHAAIAAETVGSIHAVASAPAPRGVAIAVAPKETGERSAVLQPIIEDELRAQGYAVDANASWQLRFATAVDIVPRDRSLLRLQGHVGSDSRANVGLEVPLPQWPGPASPGSVYQYNVWMSLGQAGRPAIWQAAATAVIADRESLGAESWLARTLIAVFGQTIPDQPLQLP